MRYVVDAGFCDGKPRLRVLDAESGKVRVQWSLEKSRGPSPRENVPGSPGPHLDEQYYGMQSLLKNLFLIACSDDLDRSSDGTNIDSGIKTGIPSSGKTRDMRESTSEIPPDTAYTCK